MGYVCFFKQVLAHIDESAIAVQFVLFGSGILSRHGTPIRLVMIQLPLPGVALLPIELGKETNSVEGIIYAQLNTCRLGDCGIKISEFDQVFAYATLGSVTLPISDKGNMGASVRGAAFASFKLQSTPVGGDFSVCSIVGR